MIVRIAAATFVLLALCLSARAESGSIPVLSIPRAQAPAEPGGAVWRRAPPVRVALQPAFPGHPYITGTPATREITVQAVRAGAHLYVRLTWIDATVNSASGDTHRFVDGAALQFPLNGKPTTTPFMGDAGQAVNVWYWRADGRVENLLARGFGTANRIASGGLKAAAARTENGWAVVLARPLRASPNAGANLAERKTIPVAFAVWDGDNQERDGFKSVTLEWWRLEL